MYRGSHHVSFTSTTETALPALAWLMDGDARRLCAYCGPGVEISEHGLFEGCWSDDFPSFSIDRADYVFGTGMRIREGRAIFVPPSHTLDALYVWNSTAGYCVSNSLAFLCEHCGINLPYAAYGRRFASVVLGIDAYERKIHQDSRGTLYRFVHDRFSIEDGKVRVARSTAACPFSDFASYRSHLLETLCRAMENAAHPIRKHKYVALATCSTGYDSATGAALSSEIGCRQAITFKADRAGNSDSGRELAERLGLECIEFPGHADGWTAGGSVEIEFCAAGLGGEDVLFAQTEQFLRHRLLITGFHGDSVWSLDKHAVTSVERGDVSGSSLSEFRLRVGFIHLPLPFVGCRHWPQVQLINRSDEMLPYSVGGKYDRPIPRRILEEAGVERNLFGQMKKAVSTHIFIDRMRLSRDSLRDFGKHEPAIVAGRRFFFFLRRIQFFVQRAGNKLARDSVDQLLRLHSLYRLIEAILIWDYRVFEHSHPRNSDAVFLWALEKQRIAYRAAHQSSK